MDETDENELRGIRLNAELVAEQMRPLSGLAFDYDAASVEWLDGYINRQREREDFDAAKVNRLASVLGSYLGECIRRNYGGEWRADAQGWGIFFDDQNCAYPINKTLKQLTNGSDDSIDSFFTMIPLLRKLPPKNETP